MSTPHLRPLALGLAALLLPSTLLAAPVGLIVVKPFAGAADNLAAVGEYDDLEPLPGGFSALKLTGANPKRIATSLIVANLEYPNPGRFSEISSQESLVPLRSELATLDALVKKYPAAAKYLQTYLEKYRSEIAEFESGKIKVSGAWLDKSKLFDVRLRSGTALSCLSATPNEQFQLECETPSGGLQRIAVVDLAPQEALKYFPAFRIVELRDKSFVAIDKSAVPSGNRLPARSATGAVLIAPESLAPDLAERFFPDLVQPVKVEEKWGFAHKISGTVVIAPAYDEVREFSEGMAPVRLGAKWGYITRQGVLKISADFDDASPFLGGKATVTLDGKRGTVDATDHRSFGETPPTPESTPAPAPESAPKNP